MTVLNSSPHWLKQTSQKIPVQISLLKLLPSPSVAADPESAPTRSVSPGSSLRQAKQTDLS